MERIYRRGIPFTLASVLLLLLLFPVFAMAEGSVNVNKVEPIEKPSALDQVQNKAINGVLEKDSAGKGTNDNAGYSGSMDVSAIDGSKYIPDTTIQDANKWVNKKGEDLIGLGGTLASKVTILFFMLGLFITLVGLITHSHHVMKGLIVMAVSIVVYVGCVFAPDLVHYFATWLTS